MVPSSFPLGEIIRNHDANGRIVKWSVELGEFEIEFCPAKQSRCPLPRSGLNII
jgi:hypothetical protein